MKTAITLFFLFCSLSLFGQSAWFEQTSGTTVKLNSVDFVSKDTGIIVGDSATILRTFDGGLNWLPCANPVTPNINIKSVEFVSKTKVYIVQEGFLILVSNDCGITWNYVNTPSGYWYDVFFLNENIGYLSGVSISKTTNGGQNWFDVPIPIAQSDIPLRTIGFFDANTGFVAGNVALYKTTNGGTNWVQAYNNMFGYYSQVYSQNSSILVCQNTWYNTNNRFASLQTGVSPSTMNGVSMCRPNLGLCIRSINPTYVYKSTNGHAWALIYQTEAFRFLNDISYPDSLHAYMVGYNGNILATTTGGVITGFGQISTEIPDHYSLNQNYPNPFNPVTKIKYAVPSGSHIKIIVYDLTGREVSILVDGFVSPGKYEVTFDGGGLSSGVYFYRIESQDFSQTRKMILLK